MKVTHEFQNGAFVQVKKSDAKPTQANFVIVCQYGDWSGFRTIAECLAQQMSPRPDGYFWIEER